MSVGLTLTLRSTRVDKIKDEEEYYIDKIRNKNVCLHFYEKKSTSTKNICYLPYSYRTERNLSIIMLQNRDERSGNTGNTGQRTAGHHFITRFPDLNVGTVGAFGFSLDVLGVGVVFSASDCDTTGCSKRSCLNSDMASMRRR